MAWLVVVMAVGCGGRGIASDAASTSVGDEVTSGGSGTTSSGSGPTSSSGAQDDATTAEDPVACPIPPDCFGYDCAPDEITLEYLNAFEAALDELGVGDGVVVRAVFPDELFGYALEYSLLVDWVEVPLGVHGESPEDLRADTIATFPIELLDRKVANRTTAENAIHGCNPDLEVDLCVQEPWGTEVDIESWTLSARAHRYVDNGDCETENSEVTIDLATGEVLACMVALVGHCEETE